LEKLAVGLNSMTAGFFKAAIQRNSCSGFPKYVKAYGYSYAHDNIMIRYNTIQSSSRGRAI